MRESLERLCSLASTIAGTLVSALREIFDEASYARFLQRSGVASSGESYCAFLQELERNKARRPKCC